MSLTPFILPNWFDYGATFLFAIAGTLLALRKGYDIVGVLTIAFASSVGGGLLRDGLFLQVPPVITINGIYLILVLLGSFVGVLFQRKVPRVQLLFEGVDALGLGAYAVVGCEKALLAGMALPAVILVGVVNAVGGGIFRGVLTREEPLIFRPGQFYVAVALVGCLTFVTLSQVFVMERSWAGIITIAVTFILRAMAIRFNWQTVQLSQPQPETVPARQTSTPDA